MEQQKNNGGVVSQEAAREEIARFVSLFPQVRPEDIPEEVWAAARGGESLTLAYAVDRVERLERENALLKSRAKAAALSTGSVGTKGAATGSGTLAAYWDAYQM